MIQSSYKPIELPKAPAAPERVKSSPKNEKNEKISKDEFKSELKAVTDSDEPKVKEVKVSADKELRKPSSIITEENEETNPDSISPKVFDPSMTKDVQKLISPETTAVEVPMSDEMVKALAEGEPVTDADLVAELKTQLEGRAVEAGRSPAIDFAEAEVDPELLKMEDFVAQKNLVNKKVLPQNVYGMNPQANKIAMENGLKNSQIVKDAASANGEAGSQPMNSQQFILNMMSENKPTGSQEVAAPVKTFDMSQIKSSSPDKIMTQITDYIVQAKAAKEPTVSMRMNHDELGMIDITVSKTGALNADAIAINIGTHTADGKNFFQQNSKDLFSHLSNAGLNVADMKVETSSQTAKNDFDMNGQNQKGNSQEKQFGSESNQRRHDSQKREDLWKLLNKEAA
ncbi:MAG: flagellar hook-length control protein FliK [Bdellovibrionota bacterium]